jgi:hypothetical protein
MSKKCSCEKCGCKSDANAKDKIIISKLKEVIKKLVRKQMKEVTGTGAVGGISTPYAFGKTASATAGLNDPDDKSGGYKQIGKKDTGTLFEEDNVDKNKK